MHLLTLIFDGVGIRNFGFSGFEAQARKAGHRVTYANATAFPLKEQLGLDERKIHARAHPLADTVKTIKQRAEILHLFRQTGDRAYPDGIPPLRARNFKQRLKNMIIKSAMPFYASHKGRRKLQNRLEKLARKTDYYRQVRQILEEINPDVVLNTHQRPVTALEPVLAARDLGIPTVEFIFSWDNLPKATMNIFTDYYLVWSDYMKNELLHYYPEINENQIFVTGTPQFEIHYDEGLKMSRRDFFASLGLDPGKKYLLFSGDDKRTSPDDPLYLEDLARAVKQKGKSWHILFRPVPVDFSPRYDEVLQRHKDVITRVQPLWKKVDDTWQNYFPTAGDGRMLYNLAEHTEAVFNIGSTMVFDFVAHNKPTVYFRYDHPGSTHKDWSVEKIYNLIHFRSMPDEKVVIWARSADDLGMIIDIIERKDYDLSATRQWFDIINIPPQHRASERILLALEKITNR